jgi:hypothetical protein
LAILLLKYLGYFSCPSKVCWVKFEKKALWLWRIELVAWPGWNQGSLTATGFRREFK